ncbi:MAG: metal ABC transporter solute-binding protein, Zn/Mn family, partial [Candidatus Kapaibacterium sp.]
LLGPGVAPHHNQAPQPDMKLLTDADIILYNGLHLEGKLAEVLEKLSSRKPVIAVGDYVDPSLRRSPPEFKGAYDPHIWFDVSLWRGAISGLVDTLARLDSEHGEVYQMQGKTYLAQLDTLDIWVRGQIETIPESSRLLITAHDAFGYFGRAYKIEVRGLQGISTVDEPGLADRKRMVDLIVERKIKAVFVESSVRRSNIEALIEGAKSEGHDLKIGGELFSDAMGAKGRPEGTYVGMVRANVNTIVEALK